MRRLKFPALVLTAGLLFLQACSSAESGDTEASALEALAARFGMMIPNEPLPVPDFALEDVYGRSVTLNDYRGKIVLLTFSTTW